MTDRGFAVAYLKAVQKQNFDYFAKQQLDIFDCVNLKGKTLVSVHLLNNDLPEDIKYQIETMFWVV